MLLQGELEKLNLKIRGIYEMVSCRFVAGRRQLGGESVGACLDIRQ
jgi:hypothetical protein